MAPEQSILRITHGGVDVIADENEDDSEDDDNIVKLLKSNGIVCPEYWAWDSLDCSSEVVLRGGTKNETAYFHPHWSNGTAGVRADRPLSYGAVHYWEIHVGERVFGTSLMFGVSTKKARLHTTEFKSILGEDQFGWGLSHRGRIYHNGISRYYCKPFTEYTPVVVGVLVDGTRGEVSFFKDGVSLGVAFTDLDDIEEPLYPTCTSTAAKTIMRVGRRSRSFLDLQDRCREVISSRLRLLWPSDRLKQVLEELPLPTRMKELVSSSL